MGYNEFLERYMQMINGIVESNEHRLKAVGVSVLQNGPSALNAFSDKESTYGFWVGVGFTAAGQWEIGIPVYKISGYISSGADVAASGLTTARYFIYGGELNKKEMFDEWKNTIINYGVGRIGEKILGKLSVYAKDVEKLYYELRFGIR
jgi:hypothetical protein